MSNALNLLHRLVEIGQHSETTDGQKERQSGRHENGQDDREDLKQDGGTALSATWVVRGQE